MSGRAVNLIYNIAVTEHNLRDILAAETDRIQLLQSPLQRRIKEGPSY